MASDVDIANLALTKLGDLRITSFDDNTKPAREISAVYELLRDKLQRRYVWRFCVTRAQLAASETAPEFEYAYQFQLPSDCLRILQVGRYYPSIVMADATSGPFQDYQLEGRQILARSDEALPLRYLKRVEDSTQFDATFIDAFAAEIAYNLAEALTQSGSKKEQALQDFKQAIRDAVVANALEMPPEDLQDDTWVMARL